MRTSFSFAVLLALLSWPVWSQDDPFLDTTNTVDFQTTTVGAPPPPAPVGPEMPFPPGETPPGVQTFQDFGPAGAEGGEAGGQPFISPAFSLAPQPQTPTPTTPVLPRINVVRGRWVRDAVTGEILDAPEMTTDLESNKTNYSNDGQTLGDVFADDEIWTNVQVIDSQFIGPETHTYILYYIQMLQFLHSMDALSFAGAYVASPAMVSPLPLLHEYQAHQDGKIQEWNQRFLFNFRQPDPVTGTIDPRGDFYELYVPPPPFVRPIRPDPASTNPPADFLEQAWIAFQGGTPNPQAVVSVRNTAQPAGGYYPGASGGAVVGAEGEPIGGPAGREWQGQSTYFSTTPVNPAFQGESPETQSPEFR